MAFKHTKGYLRYILLSFQFVNKWTLSLREYLLLKLSLAVCYLFSPDSLVIVNLHWISLGFQLFGCQINAIVNGWLPGWVYLSAACILNCTDKMHLKVHKNCTFMCCHDHHGVYATSGLPERKWMHFELFVKPLCHVNEFLMANVENTTLCTFHSSGRWSVYPSLPPPPLLFSLFSLNFIVNQI